MSIIEFPVLYIPETTRGRPLSGGQIYAGEVDLDPEIPANQKQLNVIQEDGTVVPVAQPFILGAGGVPLYNGSPVALDISGSYSLKILSKAGAQIYYVKNNSLVGSAIVTSANGVSELSNIIGAYEGQQLSLLSWHTLGNTGGGVLYWDATNLRSTHNGITIFSPTVPDVSASNIGDYLSATGTGVDPNATDAGVWVRSMEIPSIQASWGGARTGGMVDATISIQAVIDYCLSFELPVITEQSQVPRLVIDGIYLLSASLMIDRPEQQTSMLRITGAGIVGGLVSTTAITFFSTNYTGSDAATPANSQLSNQIEFDGLNFSSTIAGSFALDLTKFVRTRVTGCHFTNIGLNPNPTNCYIQTCYISDFTVRGTKGAKWLDTLDAYDLKVTNGTFETVGDTCLYIGGKVDSAVFSNLLSQSCLGLFVNIGDARGTAINGCYIEANDKRFIKIDICNGVSISSNFVFSTVANIADTSWYEIQLGECFGASLDNNFFVGRGIELTGTSKRARIDDTNNATVNILESHSNIPLSLFADLTVENIEVGLNTALNDEATIDLQAGRSKIVSEVVNGANGDTTLKFSNRKGGVLSESMRIADNGNLYIGNSTDPSLTSGVDAFNNGGAAGRINVGKTASGAQYGLRCYYNGVGVGGVQYDNASTAFLTSSDYRLKENVSPVKNALNRVDLINPVNFDWKNGSGNVDGFIAHELQGVIPNAVSGTKDGEELQAVDQSKIVPLLVAAIQELKKELEIIKDT